MTRYGIAIKALPKGGAPFGDDDEDQEQGPEIGAESGAADLGADPAASPDEEAPSEAGGEEEISENGVPEEAAPPGGSEAPEDVVGSDPVTGPEDDARPWSGDMYDEGDETDPAAAFAAYQGTDGEEAWLDQAPDGTLTGWIRDATGQVWRYTDPDVWAIDVDDAQMSRTHSRASGDDGGSAETEHGGQDSLFPPQQS
ncbi:hypothetical protein OG413_20310 [Streptomyces sp. NBC_01433]|uniref:hypothetical protein n=1 Tax=Streptomyces sp. NBC_01433 TaxID=2903864 RepID=UPI002252EC94|nr:hypothetical protein [Streptomyces sp. NBC_01433]MCX4677618.1 hypothetical protein [Streptomyces sp. NBC_01433]